MFHLCHYTYIWKIKWAFLGFPFRNRASISKWSFDFKIEFRFRKRSSISKSSFAFKMELRFENGASISKWSFDFKMELRFGNEASIWKWSFDFEIELRFRNGISISKWSFDFEMENGTAVLKSKTFSICLHVTTWKNASRAIEESLTKRIGKWRTACDTWERGVY